MFFPGAWDMAKTSKTGDTYLRSLLDLHELALNTNSNSRRSLDYSHSEK
jgi:hypothetical protein